MNTKDSPWTDEQLAVLQENDELELTVEGKTVIIWMVIVQGEVFVRSVYGRGSKWFQRAIRAGQGAVSAGRVQQNVRLVESGERLQTDVDAAFRSKYGRYARSIVDSTVTPRAREAALQISRLQ
ncbi:MAG: DUF2255 family protein [Candidatus Eremiobacteraeota bacterium]|nr:DUF2255 family protein [Candidatus Eremiobacteraeota bacterium]